MENFAELDHKQKREIVKEKVADWITKGVGGQITVLIPFEDSAADLLVKKRGKYEEEKIIRKREIGGKVGEIIKRESKNKIEKESGLYLKVVACSKFAGKFFGQLLKEDFKTRDNLYLIFTYFNSLKQDINDYLWLMPSQEFENLTEPELKFEAPIDFKERNQYTNFLVNKRQLADYLRRILESKKFEWPQEILGKFLILDFKKLKKFIIEARENTYAGEGTPVGNPRLIGSEQLEYKKGDYFYRDIYFNGEKNFIGQEVVYQINKPVWSMVYFGNESTAEVFRFLKKALLELSKECRFGQQCHFEDEDLRYEDKGNGTLEKFEGNERILERGKEVYQLKYLGGVVLK